MKKHSAIYWGKVRHRRYGSVSHEFSYSLFMVYLDLAELPHAIDNLPFCSSRGLAPVRYKREDYLGSPNMDLAEAVRVRVEAETGHRPTGPIRMLTHLRYMGLCFNPVTFYYCFNPSNDEVETVVAEITNTPWNQRRAYILQKPVKTSAHGTAQYQFPKDFHVSPFMPMNQEYTWFFSPPQDQLQVHMQNSQAGEKVFDATLSMKRQPLTGRTMNKALLRFPFMSWRILVAIYYQAMRLWMKGVPFHSHPEPEKELFAPRKGV